jgi:transposase
VIGFLNPGAPSTGGSPRASARSITATARKIAVLFYNALRHGMDYVDPGASSYETRYRARVIANLHRRAKAFGFVLQPTAAVAVS